MTRFIKLTRVLADVNEKGLVKMEQQIREKFDQTEEDEATDGYGRTAEWYKEMGIPVPDDLDEGGSSIRGIQFAGHINVDLDEGDYDYSYFEYLCNLEYVESIEQTETFTLIGFTSGSEVSVVETVEQIEKLINQ